MHVSFDVEPVSTSSEPHPTQDTTHDPGTTHPILSLPPEIIAEIFLRFLPSYPEPPPLVGIFSPVMPSRICRVWRQIALSTPLLWRAIRVTIRQHEAHERIAWKLKLFRMWLSRSGTCALSLGLHYVLHRAYSSPTDTPSSMSMAELVDTIMQQGNRLDYLDLDIPFEHLPLIQGAVMPRLRHLAFGPCDLPPDGTGTAPALCLFDHGAAPLLTRVVLTKCFVPAAIQLPWLQFLDL
ncbi:hypothetical protein C8R46DRAFT_1116182 [Mycena filopes]|nr:hypothetical protein C8R46DRAFT_1116182 [Mycena filopes]